MASGSSKMAARGTKVTTQTAKDEKRWKLDTVNEKLATTVIGLKTIMAEMKSPLEQHEAQLKQACFEKWANEMWDAHKGKAQKTVPENPKIITYSLDSAGKPTVEDCRIGFQVKFIKAGVNKRVPSLPTRENGKTAHDYLREILVSDEVGLTKKKIDDLLKNEVLVEERVGYLDSIDKMLKHSNELVVSGAKKLEKFSSAESIKGRVSVEPLTDDEAAAIIVVFEDVSLKDDFMSRACQYADNVEQLQRLLLFTQVSLVLSNAEFAVADKKKDKVDRLGELMAEYCDVLEDE